MSLSRYAVRVLPATILLAVAACNNPANDKPKAAILSATPASNPPHKTWPAPPASDALPIDVASSSIGFVGSKVTGSHTGKFEKFSGTVSLLIGKPEGGKVAVTVDVDSLKTDSEKLDGHLKTADFFDVAKYPKATFTSTDIKAGGDKGATHTVTGELELHGVKKTISFPATIAVTAEAVTATSEFSINRKDFGIAYAGKGDDLIRDEVVLKLSLKAPRKK